MGTKLFCVISLICLIKWSLTTRVEYNVTVYENETLSMQCIVVDVIASIVWTVCPDLDDATCKRFYQETTEQDGTAYGDWEGRASGSFGESCPNLSCSHTVDVKGAKLSDETSYYCNDSFGNQVDAPSHAVVKVPPRDAYITLPSAIIEDEPANITCVTSRIKPADAIKASFTYGSIDPINATNYVNSLNDDGKTYLVRASVTIAYKRGDQGKNITCAVVFENTTVTSGGASLNILYPPGEASPVEANVTVSVGEEATLQCRADPGNPGQHTFTWTKTHGDDPSGGEDGTLKITPQDACAGDEYVCTPRNTAGDGGAATVQLNVLVPTSISSPEGDTTTVQVLNTQPDPGVSCVGEGRGAADDSVGVIMSPGNTDVFKISEVGREETGTCPDTDGRTNILDTVKYDLQWKTVDVEARKEGSTTAMCQPVFDGEDSGNQKKFIQVQVVYGPRKAFSETPAPTAVVGDKVTLICDVDPGDAAKPLPESYSYNWTSEYNAPVFGTSELNLDITEVEMEDVYNCAPCSRPIEGQGWVCGESAPSTLTVFVRPTFEQLPPQINIINTDSLNVTCFVESKPRANATWDVDGDLRSVVGADSRNGSRDQMTVSCGLLQWSDESSEDSRREAGGRVTCTATNEETGDTIIQETLLNVQFAPYWKNDVPATVFAEFNEANVELACNDTSNPPASGYRWWKDDEILDGETSQILIIPFTNDSSIFANYTCEPNNTIGSDRRRIELQQVGPPILAFLNITDNRTSVALTLEWEVTTTGGEFDMEKYVIWCKKVNDSDFIECAEQSDGQMTSQTVMDLTPSTEYVFVIQGWNSRDSPRNTHNTSEIYAATRDLPDIILQSVEITKDVIVVVWEYTEEAADTFSDYQVGVQVVYGAYSSCAPPDYPTPGCTYYPYTTWIPAEEERADISGDFDKKTEYRVTLKFYENGIESEFIPGEPPSRGIETLSGGAIAGIVIAVLLIVGIIILAVLVQMERVKLPLPNPFSSKEDRSSDDTPMDDFSGGGTNNAYEADGAAASTHAKREHETFPTNPKRGTGRTENQDGCEYLELDFPLYTDRLKKGQKPRIIGITERTEYATIDFTKQVQLPEGSEHDDEEDVFDYLPRRDDEE